MSKFMQVWSPKEYELRQNVIKLLEKDTLDIDPDYRSEIENIISLAAEAHKLRGKKKGAKRNGKIKAIDQQTKNFNKIRESWQLLKNRVEQAFRLTSFDKNVEEYLNHWCPRINKSKVGSAFKAEKPSKGVRRYKEQRRDKRAEQNVHVNEEVYRDSADD